MANTSWHRCFLRALVLLILVLNGAAFYPSIFRRNVPAYCCRAINPSSSDPPGEYEPIRLNKVFKSTHSRRQADALISSGRVTINDEPVDSAGQRVVPYHDVVKLDGTRVEGWEALNAVPNFATKPNNNQVFEYIKYFKPVGVTCTTDRRIRDNILDRLERDGYRPDNRVYPVGRLDKETSGLILLTSDGRLPNSALRGRFKQPKTYQVVVNRVISKADIQRLREGVVITTQAQRDGNRKPVLTAPTLPCHVESLGPRHLQMTIVEGRNRQIRKMLQALGYRVIQLHRTTFMAIDLAPLQGPGEWIDLSKHEMGIVNQVLSKASELQEQNQQPERNNATGW